MIFITSYLLLYKNKLNKLCPSGQRCYHINKLPKIIPLLPKFIIFAIIKSQGIPLKYCQLEIPKDDDESLLKRQRPIQTINLNGDEIEEEDEENKKEIYKYFSKIQVMIDSISIDPLHLKCYNKLFDIIDDDYNIPICYLEAMRFSLTPYIVIKDEFPVSPLGLIHIATEIIIHSKLNINDNYEIITSLNQIRLTQKGIEIDLTTSVYKNDNNSFSSILVYECVETLLSRNKQKIKKYKEKIKNNKNIKMKKEKEWKNEFDVNNKKNIKNVIVKKEININNNIGIKYSEISGDINPHHLYKWSAMIIGYKQPIVHGMWSLQKCLTEIKKMYNKNKNIFIYKYPIKIVSTFKLPIFMPNKVKLLTNYYSKNDDYLTFALVDKNEKIPHVLGSILIE